MAACGVVLGVLRAGPALALLALVDQRRASDTYIQVWQWSCRERGGVLSSFLCGYALAGPAALLLRAHSGKLILTAVLIINGAVLLALPTIVKQGGLVAVCNAHFIMGMTHACLSPANQSLLQKWLPPFEQHLFSWLVYGGVQLGIIVGFPLCACVTSSRLGWELVYYTLAMMTLSAAVVWTLLTASTPQDHPALPDNEKHYITEALETYKKKQVKKPYVHIVRSRSFWAVTCAHVSTNVLFVFYLMNVPEYLVSVLRVPLEKSGWYAMLPFITMWFTYATLAPTSEFLYKIGFVNHLLNNTRFRKLVNALGASGAAAGLCLLSYTGHEARILALLLLNWILASIGLQYAGFLENIRDLSENLCGTVLSMSSTVSSVVGALVPLYVGMVLGADITDAGSWRTALVSLAALSVACGVLYSVLASGERQGWDFEHTLLNFTYCNDINQVELEDLKVKRHVSQESQDKNNSFI